jgi:nucleoside-diphosphate-sugar epimerase
VKVFLAGASGVIGRRLVPMLVEAGHQVVGTTRSPEKADQLRAAGAEPAVVDALDAEALAGAVRDATPEVVVNQLTNLPRRFNPRKPDYGDTARLRSEGTRTLAAAAREVGARRLISQSICFLYASEGDAIKDEEAPLLEPTTGTAFDGAIRATVELEQVTTGTPELEGVVLRYGWFYGPGTYYARDGAFGEDVPKRRFPIVGDAGGITSFVHVDDAAGATVVALDHGPPGIYNICDDDPAPMREWLPAYAEALGAKPPRRVPAWLVRLIAGRMAVAQATELRGASNAKARRELGWTPTYPSWRQGLPESLAQ